MGLMSSSHSYFCCGNSTKRSQSITIDPSFAELIKLQAHIKGYLYRKSNPEIVRYISNSHSSNAKLNLSKNGSVVESNSTNIREIALSYSTDVQESHSTIKKLKKLLPKFELNDKEKYLLNISNLKTIGLLYPDNSIYKGTINSKWQKEGFGKLYLNDGSIYIGLFKDDKIEGRGRMMNVEGFVYEGDFHNSQANGYGKLVNLDGTVYQGSWENDKQSGLGVITYKDGSKYDGNFVNGKKQGKGKFHFPEGNEYIGNFDNNEIKGEGMFKWKDGRIYMGQWENNKMNGYGIFYWQDKKTYYGQYQNNNKEGFGVFNWNQDKRYEGFWENGQQHGYGCIITKGGIDYGEWNEGKLIRQFDDEEQITFIQNQIDDIKSGNDYITFLSKVKQYEEEIGISK